MTVPAQQAPLQYGVWTSFPRFYCYRSLLPDIEHSAVTTVQYCDCTGIPVFAEFAEPTLDSSLVEIISTPGVILWAEEYVKHRTR